MNHLVIPDTQVRPGVPTDHIEALGNYIVRKQPDKIFIMGDWWDLPSLSSYNSELEKEGLRLLDDIEAGNTAMDLLFRPIKKYNRFKRSKKYLPEIHYIAGNHCYRMQRKINDHPELQGVLGNHLFNINKYCINHEFLKVVKADGFHYSHYFYNTKTGRALGGNARTKLNNLKFSFVQGHVQEFDYARQHLNNGKVIIGIVAGAFYAHKEVYLGPQGDHWRGCVSLFDVKNGDAAICEIQLKFLLKNYL